MPQRTLSNTKTAQNHRSPALQILHLLPILNSWRMLSLASPVRGKYTQAPPSIHSTHSAAAVSSLPRHGKENPLSDKGTDKKIGRVNLELLHFLKTRKSTSQIEDHDISVLPNGAQIIFQSIHRKNKQLRLKRCTLAPFVSARRYIQNFFQKGT